MSVISLDFYMSNMTKMYTNCNVTYIVTNDDDKKKHGIHRKKSIFSPKYFFRVIWRWQCYDSCKIKLTLYGVSKKSYNYTKYQP